MKFLIDQQLPATLAGWFEERGFEAVHVRDLGMRAAPDEEIWAHAVTTGAVVVTKDEDFAILRARVGGLQVLWLRIGNATNAKLLDYLDRIWPQALSCLERGEAIVEA